MDVDLYSRKQSLVGSFSYVFVLIIVYVSFSALIENEYIQFMPSEKAINENIGSQIKTYQNYTDKIQTAANKNWQNGIEKGLKLYPVKIQPSLIKLINWTNPKYPMQASYLIENKDLCVSVKNLTVLVVVNSATNHFDRRQAIRNTWTNDTYYPHFGIFRVLFLLGMNADQYVQAGIEKESKEFRDILQGDFIDTYLNLTHKGVMGYKWLTERCRNAKLILKVDDDFLVNIFIYIQKLNELKMPTNVYCYYSPGPVIRDKENKWFISENHFKGLRSYKPYCRGMFVSMTNDIIPSLYISATKTPFFPYDDVTLFGYVMHNVYRLRYQSLQKIDVEDKNDRAMKCLREHKNRCSKFVIGASGAKEIEDTWFAILKYFSKTK